MDPPKKIKALQIPTPVAQFPNIIIDLIITITPISSTETILKKVDTMRDPRRTVQRESLFQTQICSLFRTCAYEDSQHH
jgi:hypothetical protein